MCCSCATFIAGLFNSCLFISGLFIAGLGLGLAVLGLDRDLHQSLLPIVRDPAHARDSRAAKGEEVLVLILAW